MGRLEDLGRFERVVRGWLWFLDMGGFFFFDWCSIAGEQLLRVRGSAWH